jgi:hypothetical protein
MELSNANANPDSLLANLHAERESAAEEARRLAEQEEDDMLVAQHFAKLPSTASAKGKGKAIEGDVEDQEEDASDKSDTEMPGLIIKRRPAPGTGPAEPSVASLLAAKGKAVDISTTGSNGNAAATQQIKRKREGMQKLLGIKKKKA